MDIDKQQLSNQPYLKILIFTDKKTTPRNQIHHRSAAVATSSGRRKTKQVEFVLEQR